MDIPYGDHSREKYDMFLPKGSSKGTIIFLHGGFGLELKRALVFYGSRTSFPKAGRVVLPSYPQAPEFKISEITTSISVLINHIVEKFHGPIRMIGHSAGGHLASRMICKSILPKSISTCIEKVISVSGLYDLRAITNDQIK